MKPSASEEKYMLIESMKKLVNHISQSPIRQRDIFNSLSKSDFLKIVTNLNDQNIALRTISAQLLCTLTYQNDALKDNTIKVLQVSPTPGRICLNRVPQNLISQPIQLKYCLELMKQPIQKSESDKMCWLIDVSNIQKQLPQLRFLNYQKKVNEHFPDPRKVLFGFTYFGPAQKRERPTSRIQKSIQRKQQRSTSRTKMCKVSTPRNKLKLNGHLNNNRNQDMQSSHLSDQQSTVKRRWDQLPQKRENVKELQSQKIKTEMNDHNWHKQSQNESRQEKLVIKYIKPANITVNPQSYYTNRAIVNRTQIGNFVQIRNPDVSGQTLISMDSSFVQNDYQQKSRYRTYNSNTSNPRDAIRRSVGGQGAGQRFQPYINKNNFQNPMKYSYIPMGKERPSSSIGGVTIKPTLKDSINEQGLKTLKADHSQSTKSNSHHFMLRSLQIDQFTDS